MIRNPSSTQRESKAVAERGLKLKTDWISREAISFCIRPSEAQR